jgi:hypothetical protein
MTTMLECMSDHDDYLFSDARRERWIPLVRSLLDTAVDDAIKRSPKPDDPEVQVVIKEPSASGIADTLFELTPGGRLIFLLRDGRDVVASWLAAYQPGGWILGEGGFELADQGRLPFIKWQADLWADRIRKVRAVHDKLPDHRRMLVRYEDLVASPAQLLERVSAFIGVSVDSKEIEDAVSLHHIDNVPATQRHDLAHIRKGRVGSWRDELSADEQQLVCDRLGPLLKQHGYPL